MKITHRWLTTHLKTSKDLTALCEALTNLGLVVDQTLPLHDLSQGFYVVQIVDISTHPKYPHLFVCSVDAGQEKPHQVVCGAKNPFCNMYTVWAAPGALLPFAKAPLATKTLGGVESEGMLCSYRELGIHLPDLNNHTLPSGATQGACGMPPQQGVHQGIIELPSGPVGPYLHTHFDLEALKDTQIDLDITPNRSDTLSVYGIARDLAAAQCGTLASFPRSKRFMPLDTQQSIHYTIDAAVEKFCPLLAAQPLYNISQNFLETRFSRALQSIGHGLVSPVVDVANYMMVDQGSPLHVFDLDYLEGPFVLRLSTEGEAFEALNGHTYILPEGLLVSSDQQGLIALCGVMGGKRGACTVETKNILIECAYFSPQIIQKSGKATRILSESRTRFERGINPQTVIFTLENTLSLMQKTHGGRPGAFFQKGTPPLVEKSLFFHPSHLLKKTGVVLSLSYVREIFDRLGFSCRTQGTEGLKITSPSWRFDIQNTEDLIEEILRIQGYGCIPPIPLPIPPEESLEPALEKSPPSHPLNPPPSHPLAFNPFFLKRYLASHGFNEVITWSFVSKKHAQLFDGNLPSLALENPISQELAVMRTTLFAHLLSLALYHQKRSLFFQPVFEIGPQFKEDLSQTTVLTALMAEQAPLHWQKKMFDIFLAKSYLMACLDKMRVPLHLLSWKEESTVAQYHPKRCCRVLWNNECVAIFGEIHPSILQEYGLHKRFYGFEVFLQKAPHVPFAPKSPLALSSHQPVSRDLALIVPKKTPYSTLSQAIEKAAGPFLSHLFLFDVFDNDPKIGHDHLSLGIRFTLHAPHTLKEEDIKNTMKRMVQASFETCGAFLREGPVL